nr:MULTISPECIES: Hint domain-containing protein [unclassified Ruegeria]
MFNGLTVNTDAIAAAWNDSSDNTIEIDQSETGPTNAAGEFIDVLCFAAGTLIETREGPVAVEDLKISDQILTFDNGFSLFAGSGRAR